MEKRKIEIIIGLVVIILVVVSIFVINLRNKGNFTYTGKNGNYNFDVEQIGSVTFFRPHVFVDGKEYVYAFRNKPNDLEDIFLEDNLLNKLNRPSGLKDLYVTKDVNLSSYINNSVSIVVAPMLSILGKTDFGIYQVRITSSYTSFHAGEPVAPIVDCSTVNSNLKLNQTTGVVYLKLGNENKVYSDGDCIIIEGADENGLIKSGEKFAYSLIGVF